MLRSRNATIIVATVIVLALGWSYLSTVYARDIGRTNPCAAANFQLPWFNFSETYTEGLALGVAVGSTKAEAIRSAEQSGMQVDPSGWSDNRAGGVDLYGPMELHSKMLQQPYLIFHDPENLEGSMIINFRKDRVSNVEVYCINTEAI